MADYDDATRELNELVLVLGEDVHRATEAMDSIGDQYSIRQFVRAVFAMHEALTYCLKQKALADDGHPYVLTPGERMLLAELSYELDDKGEVRTKSANLPMLRNVRFAFSVFARTTECDFALPVSEDGWEKLRKAATVRNRLTHPKSAGEVEITESDVEVVRQAHSWFIKNFTDVLCAAIAARQTRIAMLERHVEAARAERDALRSELFRRAATVPKDQQP